MKIKEKLKHNKYIYKIYIEYIYYLHRFLYKLSPKIAANKAYRKVFKKSIDWKNPKDLIEKIIWLQFYTDTSLWTKCADKYLVRAFIKEKGYEDYLPKLYGKWDNASDINFNELPESFVLKSNNGCGTVYLVKDKAKLNVELTRKELGKWMKRPYGFFAAQSHYLRIEPCLIAEELLVNVESNGNSLVDYKIWCFHGKPESILVVSDRAKHSYLLSFYDLEWKNISRFALRHDSKYYTNKTVPKPKSLNKMIEIAKSLSKDIPQVRVDFYDIEGKPYFGEMTFTTGFGNYSNDYYKYLGSKIDLSKI